MDLRTDHPRSVHARFCGVVMLARVVDKARAAAAGTLGDYLYDGPMDKAVLGFLEIDALELLRTAGASRNDADVEEFVRPYVGRKTPAEVEAWNASFIGYVPKEGSDSRRRLIEARDRLAPGRDDIRTWADVLDLEDGRSVPLRTQRA
jgi:hypothetical protein